MSHLVLQKELSSEQCLPSIASLFGDWEPQQLWGDGHTGVQFDHRGACAATHGLIFTLVNGVQIFTMRPFLQFSVILVISQNVWED